MNVHLLGPETTAFDVRRLVAAPENVEEHVRGIVAKVRAEGDVGVAELTQFYDGPRLNPEQLRVPVEESRKAVGQLDGDVLSGLETAIANVGAVAAAQLQRAVDIDLPEGQRVEIAELAVRRAGAYVPAGRAAYPSSLVMVCASARAAGVAQIVVCAAPDPEGRVHPLILAACALCEVDEIYRIGGAQAIAAMAYGTPSIAPVDVIAGPGNRWVQEAKRQVVGVVGIDGVAGPSELVVVTSGGQDPEPLALDLMAQAEHGPDSLVAIVSPDPEMLGAVRAAIERLLPDRPSVTDAPVAFVTVETVQAAVDLAEAIAPEHLQLVGREAEARADSIRAAGCVLVGPAAATAFGDYVAGSNHVLPTGGAARFQSAVSPATFRRRMARVSFPAGAAARLAAKGAPLARAEGFPVHAESMERRA